MIIVRICVLLIISLNIHVMHALAAGPPPATGVERYPSGAPVGLGVHLDLLPSVVPAGASIACGFTLANESAQDMRLAMDGIGRPYDVVFLSDQSRTDLLPAQLYSRQELWAAMLPPQPQLQPVNEMYRFSPDERIRLEYDLTLLFDMKAAKPGKYTLRLVSKDAVAAQADFSLVAYRTLSSRAIANAYEPMVVVLAGLAGTGKASVRLSSIESEGVEKPSQWLLINQIAALGKTLDDLPSYSYPVPTGTIFEKAEMDYLGQVWVVAKSGDKNSLLLWRLHDLSWSVLVAPTEKKIELGTSRARAYVPNQNIVIAGVEGQTKFTTQSVWAMPRGEPASVPTTLPATLPSR
jgi:hypothetical protein